MDNFLFLNSCMRYGHFIEFGCVRPIIDFCKNSVVPQPFKLLSVALPYIWCTTLNCTIHAMPKQTDKDPSLYCATLYYSISHYSALNLFYWSKSNRMVWCGLLLVIIEPPQSRLFNSRLYCTGLGGGNKLKLKLII